MDGNNISSVSVGNVPYYSNDGTGVPIQDNPMILADSYMLYKIGRFALHIVPFGKLYAGLHHAMHVTII